MLVKGAPGGNQIDYKAIFINEQVHDNSNIHSVINFIVFEYRVNFINWIDDTCNRGRIWLNFNGMLIKLDAFWIACLTDRIIV